MIDFNLTEDQKAKRLATEEKQESKRQKALKKELDWINMSPKGRHAKSKARINNYDKLMKDLFNGNG